MADGSVMLLFPLRLPAPTFEVLDARQVRPLLAGFAALPPRAGLRLRLLEAPGAGRSGQDAGAARELRSEILSLYGPSPLPVPESMETSRLFQALQISPRFILGPGQMVSAGGPAVGAVATAKVVGDGTLIVTGVNTGTAVSSICGGLGLCAKAVSPGGASSGAKLSMMWTHSNRWCGQIREPSMSCICSMERWSGDSYLSD